MKPLKLTALLTLPIVFMACSTTNSVSNSQAPKDADKIQILDHGDIDPSSDPYNVQSLKIEDDILEIEVCFGGCAEHDWKLLTSKRYKKSSPPQLDIYLVHDQHDDLCKRQDCQTLYFDISEIKYPGKSENFVITLNLNNTDKRVNYEY